MEYPKGIPETIGSKFKDFYLVKGTEIALQIGDVRAANVVLLGAMSKLLRDQGGPVAEDHSESSSPQGP